MKFGNMHILPSRDWRDECYIHHITFLQLMKSHPSEHRAIISNIGDQEFIILFSFQYEVIESREESVCKALFTSAACHSITAQTHT